MVKYDPQRHHRRSIRLKGYDYSQAGAYFVTIVTWHREMLFGEVVNQDMVLSGFGIVASQQWENLPKRFPNIELGAYMIMPNHIHGIIVITDGRGTVSVPNDDGNHLAQGGETPPLRMPTLGQIVAFFKYQSTKEMNLLNNNGTVTKFWQRNYYEHIIRNDRDLQNKTDYIVANPLLWDEDDEKPINVTG